MQGEFGEFIKQRRKSQGITLRGMAEGLDIAPAFMCDIEKGHRYPPNKEKLYEMARILQLNEEETNMMFDLAARERENYVSQDISGYIMSNDKARVALRLAHNNNTSDKTWQRIIEILENEETEQGRDDPQLHTR